VTRPLAILLIAASGCSILPPAPVPFTITASVESCPTLGGCRYFGALEAFEPPSRIATWRFHTSGTDARRLILPRATLPATMPVGRYVVHAEALYYSDVFGSGGTRDQIGGASCSGEFTIAAGQRSVEVVVQFFDDGCKVA
jgi:hypothetical protein